MTDPFDEMLEEMKRKEGEKARLKGRLEGRCRGRIDCTGTRTSIDGIHTADAEQAHLALRGCQRQRVIVIFQQNDTLGHGLFEPTAA